VGKGTTDVGEHLDGRQIVVVHDTHRGIIPRRAGLDARCGSTHREE
jgi:hypothetical protein